MHVTLSEDLKRFVDELVASGDYPDAAAVMQAALREKMQAEQLNLEELEALRAEIEIGWQQAERGQCVTLDWEALNRELDAELDG